MGSWRLARCLEVLRSEMDAFAPHRSKASDGTIGDARHQAEQSDHNPNAAGVVCAEDFTQDPAGGADMGPISEYMRTHRHPSLTYLIFNRRIASPVGNWAWRPYSGSSPHTDHLHVSASHDFDNPAPWGLAALIHAADHGGVTPAPVPDPTPAPLEDNDMIGPYSVLLPTPDERGLLQVKPEGSFWPEGQMPPGFPWDYEAAQPVVWAASPVRWAGEASAPITAAAWVLDPDGVPCGVLRMAADLSMWPVGRMPDGFPWDYTGPKALNAPVNRLMVGRTGAWVAAWAADGGAFTFGAAPGWVRSAVIPA